MICYCFNVLQVSQETDLLLPLDQGLVNDVADHVSDSESKLHEVHVQ